MGFKMFNIPARTTRNEMSANLDRKKNGYKLSRKARTLLGISDNTSHRLAIGSDDQNRLLIKAVSENEPNNASVSKLNMINNRGVISKLDEFGNHFEITEEQTIEGYYIMSASDTRDNGEMSSTEESEDTMEDSSSEMSFG